MIAHLFKHCSLRIKLTVLPCIASLFLLAIVLIFAHLAQRESKMLEHVEQPTLVKIDKLMSLKDQLSQNHSELFALLASSAGRWDEEQIYVQGKPILHAIHTIESALTSIPQEFTVSDEERQRIELLLKRLDEYKGQAISAIEMASVDLTLANKFMVLANGKYFTAAKNFFELLNASKADTLGFIRRSREDFLAKTFYIGAIALASMAFLMLFSIRISNRVSQQIKDQIAVMKRLSDGDTNVDTPIPERRDEIADLAHGVAAFKKSLLEQAAAKELAEQANLAKSVFLANMSHELRTPLHGILSFANFGLKNGATAEPKKLHRYFSTIRDSGMTLLSLVNDVLDLAKLEAGKMSLDKRQVDLKALVAKVVDEFESMTRDKKVAIQLLSFDNKHKIQADPTRIMQVVRNLLSNALKFSPEQASVAISAREEHSSLLVSVADEGPGIPANEVEAIFDKFIQSSKTRTGAGGTGLGLAICREIIAVHGGRIWAENNPGRGAVFYFTVPLAASYDIAGEAQAPVAEPELLAL